MPAKGPEIDDPVVAAAIARITENKPEFERLEYVAATLPPLHNAFINTKLAVFAYLCERMLDDVAIAGTMM